MSNNAATTINTETSRSFFKGILRASLVNALCHGFIELGKFLIDKCDVVISMLTALLGLQDAPAF